ncbi:MAG TPA: DUF1554 domain-containing protein [Kofleriaceae bacterium]|nr:DUF1554 domain-containing protein [Kofleriaceae bacterium]
MRALGLIVAIVAGCGRIGFAPTSDGSIGGDDGTSEPPPNTVFVTRTKYGADLGGLMGADDKCKMAADSVGLQGTYVAWLSTTTVDAIDRLAGSRGWVRVDGTPVLDRVDLGLQTMFNGILLDETGSAVAGSIRTGTNSIGRKSPACADWTTTTGNDAINGIAEEGIPGFTSGNTGTTCAAMIPIYCFGIGNVATVAPKSAMVTNPHLIFVSSQPRTTTGIAALDTLCQNDVAAASLAGTFRAMVATTTTTIASRFTSDSRPVVRVDGTVVSPTMSDFLAGNTLSSFANQLTNGTYVGAIKVWTGATNPTATGSMAETCNNWNDLTAGLQGAAGNPSGISTLRFWDAYFTNCSSQLPVFCLQD